MVWSSSHPWANIQLQLRVEALNAFNCVQFGAPELNVNSASFAARRREIAQRQQTRLGRLSRWASFPFLKTIDDFDSLRHRGRADR